MYEIIKENVLYVAKEMLKRGLTDGTAGNVSVIDRANDCIAITPSGLPYEQMDEEQVCVMDSTGKIIASPCKPSSEWRMHLRVFSAREDISVVLHTHSRYSIAMASTHTPLPAITVDMAAYCGPLAPVIPYRTPGSEELAALVAQELGQGRQAVLLANHGSLVVAPEAEIALEAAAALELAAMAYIRGSVVAPPVPIPEEEVDKLFCLVYGESKGVV